MKISTLQILGLICILGTGTFILFLGSDPTLYSLEIDKPESHYHLNIQALKRAEINSSVDLSPIMQDLLDYSGPVALNIRMQDLDAASSDLNQYYKRYGNLDRLVINLEMSESEINEFQENTKLQDQLFQELMNTSDSLQTLKRLEFRYRDQNDTTSLKTIAYQGESLKKKIQTIREKYNRVNTELINQGKKFDLNTTKVETARKDINQFVNEVTNEQEDRKKQTPINSLPVDSISLLVMPESGIYRDQIKYSGFISGSNTSFKNISIFIDGNPYFDLSSDDIGQYSFYKEIEDVIPGTHTLIARWNNITSEPQNLTAIPVNTTLNLSINAFSDKPKIMLSGSLVTDKNVRYAPVHAILNNNSWNQTITNQDGQYKMDITLPEGKYLIYTQFNATNYPLFENQSQKYEVISSGSRIESIRQIDDENLYIRINLIIIIIIGISILAISYYFSRFYFKKKNLTSALNTTSSRGYNKLLSDRYNSLIHELSGDRELLAQFQLTERELGLSEAVREIYLTILNRIVQETHISRSHSFTIREITQKISSKSYGRPFRYFACVYEKIRYGGSQQEDDRITFENRLDDLDQAMKSENHEE